MRLDGPGADLVVRRRTGKRANASPERSSASHKPTAQKAAAATSKPGARKPQPPAAVKAKAKAECQIPILKCPTMCVNM